MGGVLGYSHANLLGRAVHFQFDGRASERTERFRLLLNQPYWGGTWPGSVTYLLYREEERRPSFGVEQRGAQAELARGRGRVRYSLFADYREVDLAPGADLSGLPRDLAARLPGHRDPLAHPARRLGPPRRPHRAPPRRPLDRAGAVRLPRPRLRRGALPRALRAARALLDLRGGVVAASVRAGGIEPFDDRPVSIAERLFAGGRTTHRAYGRDELGIPGETLVEGSPMGGLGLLLLNVDYRFPIAGPLGGTLFVDAGNVWPDWRQIALSEVKLGAGVGVRYLSPIGPLRLEVGWKLDREPGEPRSAVLISFGNAF